jgi:hypothetical protein
MKYILVIITLLANTLPAQVYRPILFPEKVDSKYIMEPIKEEAKFRKKVGKKIPKKHLQTYTYACTFGKSEMFKDGKIYLSWPGMENYVNQILDSIMPGTLRSKKIRAYIGRSSEINAFCLYDGTMIVNAGLLAEIKNEAALATVMGHELAHYMKNHHLNDYIKSVKKKKKKADNELSDALAKQKHSQKNELEADEIGYGIGKDAGYNIGEAASTWELFIREKEYEKKRSGSELVNSDTIAINTKAGKYNINSLEKLLSSHPDEKERQDKLTDYLKKNRDIKKAVFKQDADLFYALQKQARLESISLVFANQNYVECLDRAFRFHLLNPNEITYIWYIAESVRRICLMDFTLRKKGFLTEKNFNDVFKDNKGILHDLRYLLPNEEEYKKIAAKELLNPGKKPFETYREAFTYFNSKLISKNITEAHLQAALFENNRDKRKTNITNYLSKPDAQRMEYAQHYLKNTLSQAARENSGEIIMIPRVDFYAHTRFLKSYGTFGNTWYNYGKSEITGSEMADDISTALSGGLENTQAISIPRASTENFNTKEKYAEMIRSTFQAQRDENEGYNVQHYYKELEDEDYVSNIDVFRLCPEVWDFFMQNKIKTITYARYSRHFSKFDSFRGNPVVLTAITVFFPVLLPFKRAQYHMLTVVSYDSRAEVPLLSANIKGYRLNSRKALRQFRTIKTEQQQYIKEMYTAEKDEKNKN